jgi:hypothetical protein
MNQKKWGFFKADEKASLVTDDDVDLLFAPEPWRMQKAGTEMAILYDTVNVYMADSKDAQKRETLKQRLLVKDVATNGQAHVYNMGSTASNLNHKVSVTGFQNDAQQSIMLRWAQRDGEDMDHEDSMNMKDYLKGNLQTKYALHKENNRP